MRYRKLSAEGDYVLGGQSAFLINSPETVAQAVLTRLKLWRGEWFVDTRDGTPYLQQILGERRVGRNPDAAIRARILGTEGVREIVDYSSQFDGDTRRLVFSATISTIYGTTTLSGSL